MIKKTRVLIVDDSALMRAVLSQVINSAPDLEVVGMAPDPLVAREMIKSLHPDVLTLDVEMPRMDGLEFLDRLMRLRPMPVVMVSTLTVRGSETTLRALELGAVDFVAKPQAVSEQMMAAYGDALCEKLRAAAGARLSRRASRPAAPASAAGPSKLGIPRATSERLICIGASTGGTEAIKEVLMGMPEDAPGIVMVQHMPESFTGSFARRLDSVCRIKVKEADHGERILPGHAYLAPGHSHLRLRRSGSQFCCELEASEPVNRHRPAVDVLFASAAQLAGRRAVGVLLTGMGKDGAEGLLSMRGAGAWTVCQDQATCVVWGMPREAVALGAACEVVPLGRVTERVLRQLREGEANAAHA